MQIYFLALLNFPFNQLEEKEKKMKKFEYAATKSKSAQVRIQRSTISNAHVHGNRHNNNNNFQKETKQAHTFRDFFIKKRRNYWEFNFFPTIKYCEYIYFMQTNKKKVFFFE